MNSCLSTLTRALALSAALVTPAFGACSLPRSGPEPAWVSLRDAEVDGVIAGVGEADARKTGLSEATAAARARALASVAERIQVRIESDLRVSATSLETGTQSLVSSSVHQVIVATTNMTVQDFTIAGTWFDGRACRAWVRVELSAAEFARAKAREIARAAAAQVSSLLDAASDDTLAAGRRNESWVAADYLIEHTDFTPAPDVVVAALRVRRTTTDAKIREASLAEEAGAMLFAEYQDAYKRFVASANPAERLGAAAKSAEPLRKLVSSGGATVAALPVSPATLLADLLVDVGWLCEAADVMSKWHVGSDGIVNVSAERRDGVKPVECDPARRAAERSMQALAGQRVVVSCGIRSAGQVREWTKACSRISQAMAGAGAIVDVRPFGHQAANDGDALYMRLLADGRVGVRTDPADISVTEYRFEGKVQSSLTRDRKTELVDDYEAITGWNAVSGAIAQEFLGNNAAARFVTTLQERWKQ